MKPTITLLLVLLLIFIIGLIDKGIAIICMIAVFFYALIQLALMCKELNRNGFGKKSEL